MAGYSGTPLVKKIGIKPGHRVALVNEPAGLRKLLRGLPKDVKLNGARPPLDIVLVFNRQRAGLERDLRTQLRALAPDGMIWVSWPKQASGMATDITEDTVRELALPLGLVDVKVCAVDETWSGLKLVIRKENRRPARCRLETRN